MQTKSLFHFFFGPMILSFVSMTGGLAAFGQSATITQQPQPQTVSLGQTATFTLGLSDPTCSVAWQRNGSNISNGSGTDRVSYTTPPVTASDNGALFGAAVYSCKKAANAHAIPAKLTVGSGTTAPLQITTTQLPGGFLSGPYSASLSSTGGSAPYSWSLLSGTLPNGLSLNSAGSLSGTPTSAGAFSFTVQVNDAAVHSASASFTINITASAPTVAITSPASGATVSGTISVSGTASDGAGIASVQVSVDNGSFSSVSGTTNWAFSLNAGSLSNGSHTLTARATNSAGKTATSNPVSITVNNSTGPTVTVSWTDVHQQIDGFGASSAFSGDGITDSQADLFWSPTNGIGLSLLRVQIQSDGTYPDVATMQKAQAHGVTIWGAPWSPPATMKTNGKITQGGSLLAGDYQAYANYLSNYVLTLKNAYGIDLYAVSIQNEPDFAAPYASCIWTGQQLHDFILNNLAPTFVNQNVGAKIMLAEQAHWNFSLVPTTLNDPAAAADVSIIASHGYTSGAAPYSTPQTMGKKLWQTEDDTFDAFDGSMANGLFWAQRVSDWMTIANANAWHYWELLDSGNGDNESLADSSGNLTKRGYALGNFSKFVRPGWVRIGATPRPTNGVFVSAYKDSSTGRFAIVVINHNASSVPLHFALSAFTATTVTTWETSANLNLAQQASISVGGGNSFSATVDPLSVTTFVGP